MRMACNVSRDLLRQSVAVRLAPWSRAASKRLCVWGKMGDVFRGAIIKLDVVTEPGSVSLNRQGRRGVPWQPPR